MSWRTASYRSSVDGVQASEPGSLGKGGIKHDGFFECLKDRLTCGGDAHFRQRVARFWLLQGLFLAAFLAFFAALAWGSDVVRLLTGSVALLLMGGNVWSLEMAAASVGGFAPRPPALWLSYLLLSLGGLMAVALYLWGMAWAVVWLKNLMLGVFS